MKNVPGLANDPRIGGTAIAAGTSMAVCVEATLTLSQQHPHPNTHARARIPSHLVVLGPCSPPQPRAPGAMSWPSGRSARMYACWLSSIVSEGSFP